MDSVLGGVEISESEHLACFKNISYVDGASDYQKVTEREPRFKFEPQVTNPVFSISISGWFAHDCVPAGVVDILRQKFHSQSTVLFVFSVGTNDLR
jgi:hypothetical protein